MRRTILADIIGTGLMVCGLMLIRPFSPAAESVIAEMTTHHIIRVPVVRDGKLVGVTARADILSRLIEPEFVTVFGGR